LSEGIDRLGVEKRGGEFGKELLAQIRLPPKPDLYPHQLVEGMEVD
jgi:hypothetical protein